MSPKEFSKQNNLRGLDRKYGEFAYSVIEERKNEYVGADPKTLRKQMKEDIKAAFKEKYGFNVISLLFFLWQIRGIIKLVLDFWEVSFTKNPS